METDPDSILLQDTYDQERLAAAIIDRHYVALHYLAYSILGDADEADDAVQEGLIRALAGIDQYVPGSNMKAWLSKVIVNICRDMLRRRKVRQRLIWGLQRIFPGKPPQRSPEKFAVKEEVRTALWTLVNQLGEKHRLPIILRYVHNLNVPQISQILSVREGTVHSRLYYACQKLGRQLAIVDHKDLIEEYLDE